MRVLFPRRAFTNSSVENNVKMQTHFEIQLHGKILKGNYQDKERPSKIVSTSYTSYTFLPVLGRCIYTARPKEELLKTLHSTKKCLSMKYKITV